MGKVIEINGPLVTIEQPNIRNGEQVRIGTLGLIGEVISLHKNSALVQVYESTEGLQPGETVEGLQHPLSVELGPGLLGEIFDGVQRPLQKIMELSGEQIARGLSVSSLDREKLWHFIPTEKLVVGETLHGGELLGTVQETKTIQHRILVPPNQQGEIIEHAPEGDYTIEAVLVHLRDAEGEIQELKMYHQWPVRTPRPYRARTQSEQPLITGDRKSVV